MSEAARKHLGDVLTFQRGYDITKKEQKPGRYPVISSGGVTSRHAEFRDEGPGVVIGRKGSLGGVYWSEGPYWPHDTTLWVKDFKGNDPRYIYYFLQTLGLERFDTGASNPTLNRNHLHLLEVAVLPRKSQTTVAGGLSAFDRLIENNLRRIEIVEEMARLIYREWFVYFRFPGHEDVELVDSDLGPIPEGWDTFPLSDLVTTQYGYTESAQDDPVGPRYLRGMDMNKTSFIDWSIVPYCPISDRDREKYKIHIGDVFVIRMADPGKIGICEREVDAVFASYLVRLRPIDSRLLPYYLFFTLSDDRYQGWLTGASTGATRKSVSAKVMIEPSVVIPPQHVQAQFVDTIAPVRGLLTKLLEQNGVVTEARDLLLPRLISGELDLSDLDLDLEPVA
jgi:type I restriction enzyme S subunit